MTVEQFVMAYGVEQDRVRALLPAGYESLRPVLRINAEIRDGERVYVELNAPAAHGGKRGWLNIAHWEGAAQGLKFERDGKKVVITAPFLSLTYEETGAKGGCPAEKDHDGTFFPDETPFFRPREEITANRAFCDCAFSWRFHAGDARGASAGRTLPAFYEPPKTEYARLPLCAEHAAAIPCRQVLGAYVVRFER